MRRIIVLQTITFVFILVAMIANIVQIGKNRRFVRDGKQAHDGLCVLKADYRRRISDSRKFLVVHPKGIAGISAGTIRNSIANLQATLDAFGVISCPTDELNP